MAIKPSKKEKRIPKEQAIVVPIEEANDIHLMVDFTAMQLKLCYDKLVLYPEIQEDISNLIKKLAKI